jgi:hypothetical protein
MPVTLNNTSLLDYFPKVINKDLLLFHHPDVPKNFTAFNPYSFQNSNSDTLLVTVGDSWSWGMDLSGYNDLDNFAAGDWIVVDGIISNINNDRLTKVFGNLVSKEIGSDWLNLSIPGHGNFHMAELIECLAKIIPQLNYQKIYIICTLTEVGRWFNTEDDLFLDHTKLMDLVETTGNVNDLLAELNRLAIDRILNSVNKFDHVKLLVGTNFVDPIGLDNLKSTQILTTPWYKLLNISYDYPIYLTYGLGLCNFIRAIDDGCVPKKLQDLFKEWVIKELANSDHFTKKIGESKHFLICGFHPTADGHKIWANYVINHIT